MKILNCFKIVPDLEQVEEEDWAADDHLYIDTGYAKSTWDCFDEGALEMMLKLSDLSESFDVVYELHALTVGKSKHETFLKTLYALGYDKTIRIANEEGLSFSPAAVSGAIAQYIIHYDTPDAVVMGIQSAEGSNMKTPLLLAEQLGWPCITQVTGMEPVDEQHLKLISQTDGGWLEQVVKTPCVIAVGNAPCAYLRIPTLKDKMKLGKKPITVLSAGQVNLTDDIEAEEELELIALRCVDKQRQPQVIAGDNPREKAEILYHTYLKERLKEL